MQMRRLTRLTNGFSKKWENLWAAYCLHFAYMTNPHGCQPDRETVPVFLVLQRASLALTDDLLKQGGKPQAVDNFRQRNFQTLPNQAPGETRGTA